MRALYKALVESGDVAIASLSIEALAATPDDRRFLERYRAKTADRTIGHLLLFGEELMNAPNLRGFRGRALRLVKDLCQERRSFEGKRLIALAKSGGVGELLLRTPRDLVGWSNLRSDEMHSLSVTQTGAFLSSGAHQVTRERRIELERQIREVIEREIERRRAAEALEASEGLESAPLPPEPELSEAVGALRAVRRELRKSLRPTQAAASSIRLVESPRLRAEVAVATFTLKMPLEPTTAPSCDCGARPCDHLLAAVDGVLRALGNPADPFRSKLSSALRMPAWERRLEELAKSLPVTQAPDEVSKLFWSISVSGPVLELVPMVQRVGVRGVALKLRRVAWNELLGLAGSFRHPSDQTIALVGLGLSDAGRTMGSSSPQFPTRLAALLDGHPGVISNGDVERPLRVSRRNLEVLFAKTPRGLEVQPSLDGQAVELPPNSLQLGLFPLLDEAGGTCFIVSVSDGVRALLGAAAESEIVIPEEDLGRFTAVAPKLSERASVRFAEQIVRTVVPGETRPLVRLELVGATLAARVKVRIHPDYPPVTPGHGLARVVVADSAMALVAVDRNLDQEREVAFSALGPVLGLSRGSWSVECEDRDDALDLLMALEQAGVVCEWGESKVRARKARGLKIAVSDRRDWFGVDGSVLVGDDRVALALALDAVRAGRRYFEVAPNEFVLIESDLRDKLKSLEPHIHRSRGELEIGPTGAEALRGLGDDELLLESLRFRRTLERIDEVRTFDPSPPAGLTVELRPYQVAGFKWLRRLAELGLGACLADDMGLGKTLQAISMLLDRAEGGPALVVVPTSVGFNWVREVERFAPALRPKLYLGASRGESLDGLGPFDVLVVSYGLIVREIEDFRTRAFHTLVLDEAHAVKNPATQRSIAVRQIRADWRFGLTGTPLENHLDELWSLFRVVEPGLLGSWDWFRERFAVPIERGRDMESRRSLAVVLMPHVLRRKRSEVLTELPPKTEVRVDVALAEDHRQVYENARIAAITKMGDTKMRPQGEQRFIVLAALTLLRQICCDPRLDDPESQARPSKIERLMELISELSEEGQHTLVFSQFTRLLDLVRRALEAAGIRYVYLDGSTRPADRERAVDEFQSGAVPVFLISLKAGGLGLNLTAAENVIHLDPWWNPATEDQATGRAHRMGQTKPVTVYRLVTKGTIEEQILELHGRKRELFAMVLEGTESAGSLSTEELMDLIRLGPSVSGVSEADELETDTGVVTSDAPVTRSTRAEPEVASVRREDATSVVAPVATVATVATAAPPLPQGSVLAHFTRENLDRFRRRLEEEVAGRRLSPGSLPVYTRAVERVAELGPWVSEVRGLTSFLELQHAITRIAGTHGFPASDAKGARAPIRKFEELVLGERTE